MEPNINDPFAALDGEGDGQSHRIETLEKKLYSRADEVKPKPRTVLHPKRFNQPQSEAWEEGSFEWSGWRKPEKGSPFVTFFIFSLFFFLIAVGVAGYSYFSKKMVISPNNVSVSVFGPVSVKGGEELSVQVLIDNKNTVPLNSVQLTSDFPNGARNIGDSGQELKRVIKKLDSIDPGEVRTETVKALVLGTRNERKEISFEVRFKVEGSNAPYIKTKKFTVLLTDSPLSFITTSSQEVTAGQDFTFGVDIKANSPTLLKGSIFKIEYPKGFVFKGASIAPSQNDDTWDLGDMRPGDTKHFEIRGYMLGESNQQKVFHLSAGVGMENDRYVIGTLFGSSQASVTIKKSFLGIEIFVNGKNTDSLAVDEMKNNDVGIEWINSLTKKIINAEILVYLTGDTIDKKSINDASGGLYDSQKNTIFWDRRAASSLASVAPGEKGSVSFSFNLIPFSFANQYKNSEITITTSVKGKRVDENNVPEAVDFMRKKTIKVNTRMTLASYAAHYAGSITNRGPIPPKVGEETTYTLTWKVTNTSNDVSGAQVSAVLPLGVTWTGVVFPNGSPVTYEPATHKVTWKMGGVAAGKGFSENPAEVSFQVVLTPTLTQVMRSPALLMEASLTGKDEFTGVSVDAKAVSVTTDVKKNDPKITDDNDIKVME